MKLDLHFPAHIHIVVTRNNFTFHRISLVRTATILKIYNKLV